MKWQHDPEKTPLGTTRIFTFSPDLDIFPVDTNRPALPGILVRQYAFTRVSQVVVEHLVLERSYSAFALSDPVSSTLLPHLAGDHACLLVLYVALPLGILLTGAQGECPELDPQ